MTFTGRIGQFLFFMGFLGLLIFIASEQAGIPSYFFFCAGVPLFIAGVYLMWKYRNPPTPSERFYTVRRMREGRRMKLETTEESKYSEAEERSQK